MLSGFPGRGCGEHRGTRSRSARLLSGNIAEVYFGGDCGSSRRGPRTSPALPLWNSFCPHQDVRFGTFLWNHKSTQLFLFGVVRNTAGHARLDTERRRRENRGDARGKQRQRRSDVPTSACKGNLAALRSNTPKVFSAHHSDSSPEMIKVLGVFIPRLARSIPYQRDLFSSRRIWSTARQSPFRKY